MEYILNYHFIFYIKNIYKNVYMSVYLMGKIFKTKDQSVEISKIFIIDIFSKV